MSHFLTDHLTTRMILSWIGLAAFYLFGGIEAGHYALLILVTLDTFTGMWCAAQKGRLRSSWLFRGTARKFVMYGIFLIAFNQIGRIIPNLMFFTDWAILFLGATELLSIIENLNCLGFIIPDWVSVKLNNILHRDPTE